LRGERSKAKLLVFDNAIGKMRLATVHEGHVVLAAKTINSVLLKCLRNVRTNADMLAYKRVQIRNSRPAANKLRCYSADWKKATDHFSQKLAITVIETALEAAHAPRWVIDAVPSVCSNMDLHLDAEANGIVDYVVNTRGEVLLSDLPDADCGVQWPVRLPDAEEIDRSFERVDPLRLTEPLDR